MGLFSREEPTTNYTPAEPEEVEMDDVVFPKFSGDLCDTIVSLSVDCTYMAFDTDGDLWLINWKDGKLSVTPAEITPRKARDDE